MLRFGWSWGTSWEKECLSLTRGEELEESLGILFLSYNENFFGNSEQFRLRSLRLFFMVTL